MRLHGIALALSLLAAGCGGDSPITPTPPIAQVGGVWAATETITSATGGECFEPTFRASVGSTGTGTLQITQAGAQLTVRFTDATTGASCDYVGTAGATTIALNLTSCTASDRLGATCPNSTAKRDVRIQTGGYNLDASSATLSGTGAQTYNVFPAGQSSFGAIASASFQSRLTATKR
jgi:hypothetical protein